LFQCGEIGGDNHPGSTFDALTQSLQPLRAKSYLTTVHNNTVMARSLITIVGTGNTPFPSVQNLSKSRDVFYDAKLTSLDNATHLMSPLASEDFWQVVGKLGFIYPKIGRQRIRKLVVAANKRGIASRIWNIPAWTVWLRCVPLTLLYLATKACSFCRNYIWQVLLEEGVSWLNVDDLPAAHYF
jgi:hypothetical protein